MAIEIASCILSQICFAPVQKYLTWWSVRFTATYPFRLNRLMFYNFYVIKFKKMITSKYENCSVLKYADDTVIIGNFANNNETQYMLEVND